MEKALDVIMDDIDRSVDGVLLPCKSSLTRRSIIRLAGVRESLSLRIGETGIRCAHALQNFIRV